MLGTSRRQSRSMPMRSIHLFIKFYLQVILLDVKMSDECHLYRLLCCIELIFNYFLDYLNTVYRMDECAFTSDLLYRTIIQES